jgi:hypothetical protein
MTFQMLDEVSNSKFIGDSLDESASMGDSMHLFSYQPVFPGVSRSTSQKTKKLAAQALVASCKVARDVWSSPSRLVTAAVVVFSSPCNEFCSFV